MGISQQLELRHLRCLTVLAEELSFRRAAERLHMTQPPLSRAIARMEQLIGGRLLDRSRAHCVLTPLGSAVVDDARRVLSELDACAQRWGGLADEVPPAVRLGLFFALNPRHFGQIEREFRLQGPGAGLELVVDRTHHLLAQLRRRQLDAALVLLPAPTADLPVVPLVDTDMVALLPASHPLARRRQVRVAELAQVGPLLFMRERDNPPLYRHLDQALRQRGLLRPRYRVPRDTYSALADVAAGQACTVVCRTMKDTARRDLAFCALHPADRIPVTLGLAHAPGLAAERVAALRVSVGHYLAKVLGRR